MKPETASEQHAARSAKGLAASSGPQGKTSQEGLSGEQRRVLDCIRNEGGWLTARQIRSRVGCDGATLEAVLEVLVERQYVSRLNTLVPSYAYRLDGTVADDG